MLTPPAIAEASVLGLLREHFGLPAAQITFLPVGADANSAVFRATAADGRPYFLKLRRGRFDEVAVAVPALLHGRGIRRVMAPLPTTAGDLSVRAHGFDWMLYPYFEGRNGYEVPLSRAQWVKLGETLRAVHATALPPALAARLPRESFSPRWRDAVRAHDGQVAARSYDDPIAARFAACWLAQRDAIARTVERAEQLAAALRGRAPELAVCHADLHAGNVLVGTEGELTDAELTLVDWDEVLLAPRERDLMSVGGGLFGHWHQDHEEEAWFYEGYGPAAVDPVTLAYYRYERIVADHAAYAEQILGLRGSAADREEGLRRWSGQFLPGGVIELADRTYLTPGPSPDAGEVSAVAVLLPSPAGRRAGDEGSNPLTPPGARRDDPAAARRSAAGRPGTRGCRPPSSGESAPAPRG